MKILEINIVANHPHDDYILSVAYECWEGGWKSRFSRVKDIKLWNIVTTYEHGEYLPEHRALALFPSCKTLQEMGRLNYEC